MHIPKGRCSPNFAVFPVHDRIILQNRLHELPACRDNACEKPYLHLSGAPGSGIPDVFCLFFQCLFQFLVGRLFLTLWRASSAFSDSACRLMIHLKTPSPMVSRQQALRCRWPFPWHLFHFLRTAFWISMSENTSTCSSAGISNIDSIPASPGIFWPSGTETPHPTYSLQNNLHNLTGMWIQTAPTGLHINRRNIFRPRSCQIHDPSVFTRSRNCFFLVSGFCSGK